MSQSSAIATYLIAWAEHLDQQGKSPRTIAAYHRGMQHFMDWVEQTYQASFAITKIIPRDVRHWKTYQQSKEKASPATVNLRLTSVSRFFQWAVKQDFIDSNPTDDVQTLHLAERHPKALSDQAVRKLLREAKDDKRDYALLELLICTGLRVGEALALTLDEIVINERSGMVIVRHGKRGGYREIPLVLDVRKAISAYLETDHPSPDDPGASVWINHHGKALTHRSSVMRILKKYTQRAGLETVTPHMLRHTFATRYLNANLGDLRGLARLLGHTNLNTVMIYTEPTLDDLADRMERMA